MKQDLDISNIKSKPAVVLVSNQSEYDQLMKHLEKEGKMWLEMKSKPTEFQPVTLTFPYGIRIGSTEKITWISTPNSQFIPFPEYAAKHIKPKRKRKRIEKSKYDEVMAERDRLKAEKAELKAQLEDVTYKYRSWQTYGLKCRDQRDMARLIAALLLIVSVGFAIAVRIGKLVPVV